MTRSSSVRLLISAITIFGVGLGLASLSATAGVQQRSGGGPAHGQALRLPGGVIPEHYDVAFTVDLARARFEGNETIRVRIKEPTRTIVMHALDLELRDATVSREKAMLSLDPRSETVTLTLATPVPAGPAQIRMHFAAPLNEKLRGFYLSRTDRRRYAVTQFESTDARRAFPCFDEPALKATFDVTLVIDRGDTAISNGRIVSDTPGPGPSQHTVRFATSPRMSSYLVAMAVGDFECVEGAQDGIPIRVCAIPEKRELTSLALESARQILEYYDRYFAMTYPFAKLDLVAVPDFAAGAMENTAAIFYREAYLLADARTASVVTRRNIASVIAHEMAHQWFGDLVTMAWWDDLWLNEGFATWMANHPLAAAHTDWNVPVDEARDTQTALDLDSLEATRPVHAMAETPSEIEEAFDAIAYEKGAAVLRMVERYVGSETFKMGVNAYLRAHAYSNATSKDFWSAVARTSDRPVDRIMPTFVNQPGAPLLDVSISCQGDSTVGASVTRATMSQTRFFLDPARQDRANETSETNETRWTLPICMKEPASEAAGVEDRCSLLERRTQTVELGGCAPWLYMNAGATGYYRTRYAPMILRAMAPHVEDTLSAPERLSLIGDEWAMVMGRRHSIADYLTLASGYGREHSSGVLSLVAEGLAFTHEYLTTDTTRPRLESFVQRLFHPLYAELGFTETGGASDERQELRARILRALGIIGADPAIISKSRDALARALSGGPALESTTADTIVDIAARHGDRALYDLLAQAAGRRTSPEEHYRYLHGLTSFSDAVLVDRSLARVLSPELRRQDAAQYLARLLKNPAARDRTWSFVKARWVEIEPKLTVAEGDTTLVRGLAAFCDARSRDDIKAFFAAHHLPVAARTLNQTIESIDNCIALRQTQAATLEGWLKGEH